MIDFAKMNGLVPAVVQDDESGEVLMVGFMNETALARTRETGFVTFFSRTRNALWTKGETSGNRLAVKRLLVDCDEDTLLVRVERQGDGNVCHTGERSCFFRDLPGGNQVDESAPRASEASRGVAAAGGGAPAQEKKR
jgi:phosphoribosyl-AMP cyclohydrolase